MNKLFIPSVRIAFALMGLAIVLGTVVSTFNYERSAQAAYNAEINYQGKLTNGSNVAVADGTYNMEFKLYDAVSGGSLVWTETRTGGNKVQVTNGVFSVMLGEVNAFGSLDFNQTLFLSVNIGGTGSPSWDGEMTPRKKIGTVPVAFLASNLKGTGLVDITNTATQATFNYDGSNRATLGVASNGFTTLTSVGSGAGWNLTGGNVGIGTATTSAKLHVTATTEQLRVGYDAGNYTSFTTSSGGDLTIAPSGSDLAITGNVDASGTLTAGTANAFNVNASGQITAGTWQGSVIGGTYGGTGVNNGSNTITLGGNINTAAAFTTAGANALTLTTTGTTNVTLPTSGTLITSGVTTLSSLVSIGTITTGVWNGTIITGTYGGTGINTASSTGVPSISSGTWSVNAQLPVSLGGTGTVNGSITGTGALSFTAGSTAQNVNLIASTTGSVVHSSSTANTDTINIKPQTTGTGATFAGIITTADLTGADKTYTFPNANITVNAAADISGTTLAAGVTASSLTSVGTIATGVWNGTVIGATYGGTGVNNGSNTITLGGNINTAAAFTTSGANPLTLTTTGTTNVTLPTTGTLVNTAVTTLSSLVSIGTVTTGTWNATQVAVLYGGTGSTTSQGAINNLSQLTTNGDLLYHNGTNSTRLARGADTECLKSTTTTIAWGSCGGSGTPWTSAIDADAFALQDALNLEFRTAAGSAPAGTVISFYADNSGDLTANVLSAKTFNIAVAGTDEYNFSSTALAMNSNNITGLGTTVSATAALTISSGGSSDLTLDSASGRTKIATGDFLQTSIAGTAGAAAGDIWYDSTALKYKINENGTTKTLCNTTDAGCGAGGSTAFDVIADPSGNGAIAMGTTVQTLDWGATTTTDNLTVTSSATGLTSGSAFKVTAATTGAVTNGIVQLQASANYSSGPLLSVKANSTTTGKVASFTGSALTTGTVIEASGGSTMTSGKVLSLSGSYAQSSASSSDLTTISLGVASSNTTGTATTNGLSIGTSINTTGAGIKEINGLSIANAIDGCASGACTYAGLRIVGGSDTNITSYGAYIDAGSGAGTEYAAAFMNGNVGIGTATPLSMLQVGAAANRGDITVYGDLKLIGADIQRTLSGIVDIFVYDTSRDSDGGEWRNSLLSQQMSWATESKDDGVGDPCVISSDDRCGTSVFPRKAILVTTADALYIFDGSDNSLWMKFTQAGTYSLGADANNNPSGVGAQNGVVVVGTNGSSGTGMYAIDFKQDVMYRYNTTNRTQADINIGSRNSTATYSDNAETGFAILNNIVNDVSVAVQLASNEGSAGTLIAPIDSQGGPLRGVTIIAAANDSGVSVINMGTRKVINYSDVTNDDYNQVVMTSRGRMYATNETQAQLEEWKGVDTVSTTQANGTPGRVYDETIGKSPITTGTAPTMATTPSALAVIERSSSAREAAAAGQTDSGDIVFVGTNQGLAEVHTSGGTLVAASWSKLTTTTVATPYMVGAVRAAFPFDEAAGSTNSNSAIGTAANNARLDQAGATAPTYGTGGVRGNSVNFNNNSYLCSDANDDGTCDSDTIFNAGTTSFTVSLWFKHSVTAASDTLFERCYTPATPAVAVGCIWAGMTSSGTIKIGLDSITTWTYETTYDDSVTSTATYNDNQWHHLVYTNTDTDICLYIDGRQAAACDTALAATATLDAAQVLTVGGACSGAACATGTNYWDGQIDDMVWSSNGGTTGDGLTAQSANKLYLDGRAHMIRPNATVTDATTFSSTTIGDSGESYVPDSFVGLVVELTGGTGSGQTRNIISNSATTFTVYPAFTVTPDTTTDYQVSPTRLYGASNNVTAISVDAPTQLNRVRKVYVGTSDGADGGGVTVYTNAGAGSIKTQLIHAGAGYADDDLGSSWSGTGSDNITAMSSYSETLAIGNGAFFRASRNDASLKQVQGDTLSAIEDIRQAIVAMGNFGYTQDVLGLGQGADLAEYYYSTETLDYGDVVVIDPNSDGDDVVRSDKAYASNVLGVVSTRPGVTLGNYSESGYPIALKGRIPVKFSDENGPVKTGDYLTTSSIPGYSMRATGKGVVIGKALADSPKPEDMNYCSISNAPTSDSDPDVDDEGPRCGMVTMFVEQGEHAGVSVDELLAQMELVISDDSLTQLPGEDSVLFENGEYQNTPNKQDKILAFLKQMKEQKEAEGVSSQILTDRLSATFEVITPNLVADGLEVLTIGSKGKGINMLADLTFIGRPFFNSDTAGFAKIVQGDRYVDIAYERPYLEQPTVTVNITQEQDSQILEEINQQVIDSMRVIDDANVELLFGSDLQFLVTRKSQNGFRIILNKPAPQDITFSWITLAVKQPRLVISDGLGAGDYIPAITENSNIYFDENYDNGADTGIVAGDSTSNDVNNDPDEQESFSEVDNSTQSDQSDLPDSVQDSPPLSSNDDLGLE